MHVHTYVKRWGVLLELSTSSIATHVHAFATILSAAYSFVIEIRVGVAGRFC